MSKLDPAVRAAIVARLHEQPAPSRYAIAKEFGVTQPTVVRIAKDSGLAVAEQSPVLKAAVDAHITVARQKRAALANRALDEAALLLDSLHRPMTMYHYDTKMGCFSSEIVPKPTAQVIQSTWISFGIAVDKAMMIEKHDSEGPTASKIAIIELVDMLKGESTHAAS